MLNYELSKCLIFALFVKNLEQLYSKQPTAPSQSVLRFCVHSRESCGIHRVMKITFVYKLEITQNLAAKYLLWNHWQTISQREISQVQF